MAPKTVLAIDLGAESGRVMAVHFDGRGLRLEELHRFPNGPVVAHGAMYWDILRLWQEIQAGIARGRTYRPASIGVDAWGVDFALLDRNGDLIGNPVCYRDRRTEGMMAAVFEKIPREEVFARTGIQFLALNTLFQMMSLVVHRSPQLEIAATFLTIPDLINFWLTGARVCEFTNATTTQMLSAHTGTWARGMLEALGIPTHIFPEIVPSGNRLGVYEDIPVTAPACHDTGSAVAAVPARTEHFAYISSGTWSLVGLEVDTPIVDEAALAVNATNEGGVYGTYRLLKNVMGLWLLQQCRATWQAAGHDYDYPALIAMAEAAEPLRSFIAPDDARFLPPGDHPARIRDFCAESGQPVPESHGAVVRCVFESLALAYRDVLEKLAGLAEKRIDVVHIVGGGSRNRLLDQMTADATGLPVLAGPAEATVIGNALVQLITLGEIADRDEGRRLVAEMGRLTRYEPRNPDVWDAAYERYRGLRMRG